MSSFKLLKPENEPVAALQPRKAGEGLFVLAEAAINDDVRSLGDNMSFESILYWDEMGRQHASISPYLLSWPGWDEFAETVGFQPNWGIFIELQSEFVNLPEDRQSQLLMAHLREWSLIDDQSESGESTLLRLSDWQVWQRLLSASSAQQQLILFGPVARFGYWLPQSEQLQWIERPALLSTQPVEHVFPQRLTTAQWQALIQMSDRYYQQRYCEHLRAYHQVLADWDDEKLADYVETQVIQANQYAFTSELDIVRYLSLTLAVGVDFIQSPWAQQVMKARAFEGTKSRMDRLMDKALALLDQENAPT
ncbi:DUF4123 domain-containing protein [Celerinatantimonas sp. YJH-8]|uniref:DUF4123 domain-containing protein n=1 Tax=Celerinatantimonas sp. YJH-8 TaxID=3228714 RepID=UPI0038C0316A